MTFTVTYRGADGALREEAVEAASRAECFAKMKARGIVPVSVREGARKGGRKNTASPKMATQGGAGRAANVSAAPRGGTWKAAVLATVLLAAAGGAWWWLAAREDARPPVERPKAVKEAKSAKAPKVPRVHPRTPIKTNAVPATLAEPSATAPKPFNPNEPPPGLLPNEPWRSGRKKLHKVQYVARNTNTVHRNSTEQALLDIFTCEVGDPPLPLTDLPKEDLTNMWNILRSPNPITEKDAEEVKIGKEILEQAKKELMKFIRDGGNPDEFLSHYHGILEKAYQKRMIATEEIYKVLEEQNDPEIARAMLKRVNRELREEGIRPLPIPISVFQQKEQQQ